MLSLVYRRYVLPLQECRNVHIFLVATLLPILWLLSTLSFFFYVPKDMIFWPVCFAFPVVYSGELVDRLSGSDRHDSHKWRTLNAESSCESSHTNYSSGSRKIVRFDYVNDQQRQRRCPLYDSSSYSVEDDDPHTKDSGIDTSSSATLNEENNNKVSHQSCYALSGEAGHSYHGPLHLLLSPASSSIFCLSSLVQFHIVLILLLILCFFLFFVL